MLIYFYLLQREGFRFWLIKLNNTDTRNIGHVPRNRCFLLLWTHGWQRQVHAVLRIHDILVWIRIRIRGSMPVTNGSGLGSGLGSGSGSFYFQHWPSRCQQKTNSYYICWMKKGSGYRSRAGFGSESIPLTNGSGSGSPKNTWIRWSASMIIFNLTNFRCGLRRWSVWPP